MTRRYYYPALRGRFGDWAYYSTLMTLEQISERIDVAANIHKSKMLSRLIQRELKGGRAKEIARYLHDNEDRFFNSLVVAVYGGNPSWQAADVVSNNEEVREGDLDTTARYSIGFLSLTNEEEIFALDGQHRLAGIKEALKHDSDLADDELSVIFVAHHRTAAGEQRTRKLFTTLNKSARPVSKPEIIALDESDIMAISTRYLIENHKFFSRGQVDVLRTQANLPVGDKTHLLTVITLYDLLAIVFSSIMQRVAKESVADLRIYRPSDERIAQYNAFAGDYFEKLAKVSPELKKYFNASDPEAVMKNYRRDDGGHILFRPVGLRIFTEVIRELCSTMSFEDALKLIKKLPTDLNTIPYAGTVWSPQGKVENKWATLCRNLLLHMLGYGKRGAGELKSLKKSYAQALGEDESDVELPALIR